MHKITKFGHELAVTVKINGGSSFDFERPILDIIKKLTEIHREHPFAYVEEGYYPYDDASRLFVYDNIPETDEQMNTRLAGEAMDKEAREARELAELKRLQEKYQK